MYISPMNARKFRSLVNDQKEPVLKCSMCHFSSFIGTLYNTIYYALRNKKAFTIVSNCKYAPMATCGQIYFSLFSI